MGPKAAIRAVDPGEVERRRSRAPVPGDKPAPLAVREPAVIGSIMRCASLETAEPEARPPHTAGRPAVWACCGL